jgi:hypothetical protein
MSAQLSVFFFFFFFFFKRHLSDQPVMSCVHVMLWHAFEHVPHIMDCNGHTKKPVTNLYLWINPQQRYLKEAWHVKVVVKRKRTPSTSQRRGRCLRTRHHMCVHMCTCHVAAAWLHQMHVPTPETCHADTYQVRVSHSHLLKYNESLFNGGL